MLKDNYYVKQVSYQEAIKMVVEKHYLHRKCSISYAYGLFEKDTDTMVGIVTYGQPPSRGLQESICGKEEASNVVELNRLYIDDTTPRNAESFLISRSLKEVPYDIIVSFADANMKHVGYVYQATNFMYTGKSKNNYKYVDKYGNDFHFRKLGHMRKGMDISQIDNQYLIKVRTNAESIDTLEVCEYLKQAKNKSGLTTKQIDNHFGYKHTAGHWFRTDHGKSLPSVDDWIELEKLLELDDKYHDMMTNHWEYVYDRKYHMKELGVKRVPIQSKHRYVFIKKPRRKELMKKFKLEILDYPKLGE